MDRLLNEQERVKTERVGDNPRNFSVDRLDEDDLLKAQLAKVDKEWVEWVENTFGNSIAEYYTEIWAERKRELKTANKINVTLQHQIDIIVRAAVHSNNKEWVEWLKTFIYNEYGTIIIQDNCLQSRLKEIEL